MKAASADEEIETGKKAIVTLRRRNRRNSFFLIARWKIVNGILLLFKKTRKRQKNIHENQAHQINSQLNKCELFSLNVEH